MSEPLPVAAGIVSFHPDAELLLDLVAVLSRDVDRVYLFNNASLDPALEMVLADYPKLVAIEAGTNLGVGVGLNVIALAASRDGYERLALFDQDSRPWPGMLPLLGAAFDRLEASRRAPAAVAPRLVAPRGRVAEASKPPRYRARRGAAPEGDLVPVDFLPTSGTLFNLVTLRETGLFRADFFIDAIDTEWCFRAWARGRSCWLAPDVPMEHTVGTGTIPLGFGLSMPNQRPFRMGTYLRNNLYALRLRHVPLGWKLKQIAYLPLQGFGFARHHGFRAEAVRPMLRGLADGLRGRLGVPPGLDP
ncbi:glycosyltransferase family 2 protein [Lichenibacterium dinghuense]|uniref:glycosyltransferase family 2 protein n=1 Tax=Lichenibacterium dinghuense TaxID=2895977 RepID=UPI001F48DDDE|nr:glycosyltransferase family 2 protein [Lichenibacterium sp. 6Y81]